MIVVYPNIKQKEASGFMQTLPLKKRKKKSSSAAAKKEFGMCIPRERSALMGKKRSSSIHSSPFPEFPFVWIYSLRIAWRKARRPRLLFPPLQFSALWTAGSWVGSWAPAEGEAEAAGTMGAGETTGVLAGETTGEADAEAEAEGVVGS